MEEVNDKVIPARTISIVVIPDFINGNQSGAHSARATVKYLRDLGYRVAVYSKDVVEDSGIEDEAVKLYKIPTKMSWYEFLYSPRLVKSFNQILIKEKPSYVLFVGSMQKPSVLGAAARKMGIKTTFLFYINDYYCHKTYAGSRTGPCSACINNPISAAFTHKCRSPLEILHHIKACLVKFLLAQELMQAYKVLNYGENQRAIAKEFGIKEENLATIGFQFDPATIQVHDETINDKGYFAIAGTASIERGWHLLTEIFSKLESDAKFKISFLNRSLAKKAIEKFDIQRFIDVGRVDILIGERREDYLEFLASSRGVLIPSYYSTTGEFVLQEALYLGKPLHVFSVGVHTDIFIDQDNALVSMIGDIDDYAGKIDLIQSQKELRETIGLNAKELARSFYGNSAQSLLAKVFG